MGKSLDKTGHEIDHVLLRQGQFARNLGGLVVFDGQRQNVALVSAQSLFNTVAGPAMNAFQFSVLDASLGSQWAFSTA